jgi:hypothetical protein
LTISTGSTRGQPLLGRRRGDDLAAIWLLGLLALDRRHPALEVDLVPTQREDFAAPHPGGERDLDEIA